MKKRDVVVHSEQDAIQALDASISDLRAGVSNKLSLRPAEEYVRCDFCSAQPSPWTYPCRSFQAGTMIETGPGGPTFHQQDSLGNWAACEDCHALIEAPDLEGLKRRMITILEIAGEDLIQKMVFGQLQGFFANRTGDAYLEKENE